MPVNDGLDKATGRYYCSACFEPTSRVILSQKQDELNAFIAKFPDLMDMKVIFLSGDPEVEEDLKVYMNREDEYHRDDDSDYEGN